MTRSIREPRGGALARVLADAERAAWSGDGERARNLLRLADRLASRSDRPELLAVAESVRSGIRGARSGTSTSQADGRRIALPPLRRVPPLFDGATRSAVPASGDALTGAERRGARPAPSPRRARKLLLAGFLVAAGLGVVDDPARTALARVLVVTGYPRAALCLLANSSGGGALLVRGDAWLADGDTARGVADYAMAAGGVGQGGRVAFEAGARLDQIGGHAAAAADAYLRAYAGGIGQDRWATIADALKVAGREVEANRVLRGVGR